MENSPFPFQGPLAPHELQGRDGLVDDLIERISSRRVTALLGPRRYGKTSVLHRVAAVLGDVGVTIVHVDLYEVSSMADVAVRLDQSLDQARGPGLERLRILVSGEISLGVVKLLFAKRAADRPDPVAVLHVLLDSLVEAASRHPMLVVFDEFQGIDRVDGAAGLLRTKLQGHVRELGLVFAGSQPSLMRSMFTDVARPFYGQADLVEIGPLSARALQEIVAGGFAGTGRDSGNLAAHIHEFTAGHPQRSMQLADAAWRSAVPGESYDPAVWGRALDDVRRQSELANESMFSRSQSNDQKLLRLIANGQPLFGTGAGLLELSPGSGQSSRDRLVDLGEIMRAGSGWRLVDPVYADWIRRRFPM